AVIIDSVTRLIPGVLGKTESLDEESHSIPGYLEYPQYTRPEAFYYKTRSKKTKKHVSVVAKAKTEEIKKSIVPKILLSGHHKNITEWRNKKSKQK
ncbi:hypothetical protein HQ571_04100, partial [Candidatus Kuenenbacteria bacterium]|nr:hypothetical protein [Candidatus Kuenenbacteria bacterium]